MSQTLLDRIAQKKAHVGVIGQGYVGLPLALVFQDGPQVFDQSGLALGEFH